MPKNNLRKKLTRQEQRDLDVVQLHKILLERVLGISEEAIRNQENAALRVDHDGAHAERHPARETPVGVQNAPNCRLQPAAECVEWPEG